MKLTLSPSKDQWSSLTSRPSIESTQMDDLVSSVFREVKQFGDNAVRRYTKSFDQVDIAEFKVSTTEIENAVATISTELKEAIQLAATNIERFHATQLTQKAPVETTSGVTCWRESRGIENVGIYIPGGSAPLFSTVLMLGIPARIAACKNVVLCTPPNSDGEVNNAILYAASLVGITTIFKVGGIQAIAAMSTGTASIPQVDKIFGPGNQYVTAAKEFALSKGIAIDMPAGPSEVLVIADETAVPEFVAADLLSQAEHGPDSQVVLLSPSQEIIERSMEATKNQLAQLPRKDIAQAALNNSRFILLSSIEECIEFSNTYAPEHLILASSTPEGWLSSITNAGSVFVGNLSCESAGDYASGTNHTLPTNGFARSYSGVSVDSFVKKITFQQLSETGLKTIGPAIELMAEKENLFAHKNAVSIRLNALKDA